MRRQIAVGLACLIASTAASDPAAGGQTRYDSQAKPPGFVITYTYARLPSVDQIMSNPAAMLQVGQSQESLVTARIDDEVRGFLGEVNQILFAATRGLAVITRLEHVQEIEKADFIIALGVASSRGGVATPLAGSGEGRPGHFNLYFENLAQEAGIPGGRAAIALTVAHELCHYFFGLPDEYLQRAAGPIPRCPTAPGLGCLMDNYQPGGRSGSQGGWMGHLCSPAEHRITPENGYFTAVTGSCQEIVSAFFRDRGVANFESLPERPTASEPSTAASTNVAPRLIQTAAAHPTLKEPLARLRRLHPAGLTAEDRKELLGNARTVLLSVLGAARLSEPDLIQASLVVLGLIEGKPPRLAAIETILVDEARSIRAALGQPRTQAAIQAIVDKLIHRVRTHPDLGGSRAAPRDVTFSPDEMAFLDRIAAGTDGPAIPPIEGKRPEIGGARRRQTVIYTPMPIRAQAPGFPADLVKTQGDPVAKYSRISRDGSEFFEKLLRHNDKANRIQIRSLFAQGSAEEGGNLRKRPGVLVAEDPLDRGIQALRKAHSEDEKKAALAGLAQLAGQDPRAFEARGQELGDVLDAMAREIEAGRLENIVLLIPPGGLPEGFDRRLDALADQVAGKTDVRLDIALVGSVTISHRLRDLSARRGGTVQTITGVDEIGAAFQRLSNAQTQGSWIAIPEQGRVRIKPEPALPPGFDPPDFLKSFKALYERYDLVRALPRHAEIAPADPQPKRIAFKPFYSDGLSEVELIVGLSQPLAIRGATPGPLMGFKRIEPSLAMARLESDEGHAQFEKVRQDIEEHDAGFDALPQGQDLALDPDTSSPSYLVFRMPALADGGIGPGWYAPVLELAADHFREAGDGGAPKPRKFAEDAINYTFSVGKPRSNTRVLASLVQTTRNAPEATDRGTIRTDRVAVVQAEVNFGLPVQGAQVTGYVQRIDDGGTGSIRTIRLAMRDDGQAPDLKAGDGIYSMTIPLGQDRVTGAEYRVFVEALTTPESRFIPMESIADAGAGARPDEPPRSLPTFQRATSLNFRVAPAQPD